MRVLHMNSVILLLLGIFAVANSSTDWWQTATFYQIYPRSFKDDDNDGTGDLQGVISKLTYLKKLGITATWLSPIFKSPGVDQGYDISDYRVVDPLFGNNTDLKELIEEAKKLGIKIILDFVPNHTSDEHEWFQKSLQNDPKYKDYYIWRDGANKDNITAPNNWISNFGGIAWNYSDTRQMWYYHEFADKQPDLNYRNKDVVQEMKDILIYWMDQGVAGFRIDAVPYLFEDEKFENETVANDKTYNTSDWNSLEHTYTSDLNETLDMIYQFRTVIDEYNKNHTDYTRVIMTEAYSDLNKTLLYYGTNDGSKIGAHFTFNFEFVRSLSKESSAKDIKDMIDMWLNNLPKIYTHNWVIGNHDNHRIATRLGVAHVDPLMMLQAILPGVMVTYNGEEIGMEDGDVPFEERRDPQAIDNATFYAKGRDFERTPFQWDTTINGGFNNGTKTWLPVSDNYKTTNVDLQSKSEEESHLKLYKRIQEFRKKLSYAADTKVEVQNDTVLTVHRTTETETYVYVYNRLGKNINITIDGFNNAEVLIQSTGSKNKLGSTINGEITLEPNESIILHQATSKHNGSFNYKIQPTILLAVLFVIYILNM